MDTHQSNRTAPPSPAAEGRFVVLAAVDRSGPSEHILRAALQLARTRPDSEVHFVHVIDRNISPRSPLLDEARAIIDSGAQTVVSGCPRVTGHVAVGEPWREIVQVAANIDADWIVIGTHGRTGLARVALGSVAEAVVRHAGCPVLVVRPKRHAPPEFPAIEPPCPDCLKTQRETRGARLWCARHSEHHPRGHLHFEYPASFGIGSSFIRP